jgi:uncharacterized protein HemY
MEDETSLVEKIQLKLSEKKYKDAKNLQKELGIYFLKQKNYKKAKEEFEKLKNTPIWFELKSNQKINHKKELTTLMSIKNQNYSICIGLKF